MTYVLVPRLVSSRIGGSAMRAAAEVWVGALGKDPHEHDVRLTTVGGPELIIGEWDKTHAAQHIWHATCAIPRPAARREIKLIVDRAEVTSAHVSPLPNALCEGPFRVLLASCFDPGFSRSRRLKRRLEELGTEGQPHVKLLCGDQVYLDPTFPSCLALTCLSPERRAASIYRRTWTNPGFRALLGEGLNVFCPDDHDFWDNYTVDAGRREPRRAKVAKGLLHAFQSAAPLQTFDVPPLRFMIVDTRGHRTDPLCLSPQVVDDSVLRQVVSWLSKDEGPAVLVLGQPLLGEVGYEPGRHGSDILQYKGQFQQLADALLDAPCSVVILSGDVHWGRVAYGTNRRGKALVEVISSPLSLSRLRSLAECFRPWRPAVPDLGSERGCIKTAVTYKVTTPHFATLDFTTSVGNSAAVSMVVSAWPLRKPLCRAVKPVTYRCTL